MSMSGTASDTVITTIDLLRHGEPEGGVRYRGTVDDPLSERGWVQMRAAVGGARPWQVVVSSPLRRCADFARTLAVESHLALDIEPRFREMGFGAWEGRTVDEILAATPEALNRFWQDPIAHPPPDGEPLQDCAARVAAGWHDLLARHAGRRVLVIGHGGMIRLVLHHILEMPLSRIWRLEVPYATLSRVRVYRRAADSEAFLVFHGKGSE